MKRVLFPALAALVLAACNNSGSSALTDPINLSATDRTSSSVTLTWGAANGASGYAVERKSGSAAYTPIATPAATAVSYTDGGLSADTSYTYRVSATNGKSRSKGAETTVRTATATPVKFKVDTLKSVLDTVWTMRFAPDGRLLFTLRSGNNGKVGVNALDLKTGDIVSYGGTSAVLTPEITGSGENGVMGMDLDPAFASNSRLYVCYTYGTKDAPRNRVSSFTLSGSSLTAEKPLLEMSGGAHHNGCRVALGPDGKLYVSMGDNDPAGDAITGTTAQELDKMAGKIFRINLDGSIPTDNPFYTTLTGSFRAIWTYGHHNPQGLAFQPGTGALWSTEHGPKTRDEINVLKAGKNYGWPRCSGVEAYGVALASAPDAVTYPCTGPNLSATNYQPAVKEYAGGDAPAIAPSNLIFYTGSVFPAWKNDLFFVTLKTGRLYRLKLSGESVASDEILINSGYGRLRDIAQGPDGLIYLSTDEGLLLRLSPQ